MSTLALTSGWYYIYTSYCTSNMLHLTQQDPWAQHIKVICSYFQQFLYWGTLGFIFTPQMVVMWLSILKHQLIRVLVEVLLCESYMSIQTIDISDLGETLMIYSFKVI